MSKDQTDREANDPGLLLLNEAVRAELLTSLIRQLNKDFQLSGVECCISEDASPQDLAQELKQNLEKLIRDDFQGFLNVLYRVDVKESDLHRSEVQGMDVFINAAAYQLLRREWQKVWLRSKTR
jgi:hypothetical protein